MRLLPTSSGAIADQGFEGLPITVEEAVQAGGLPGTLSDPFDRMLIAQALSRNLVLISNETTLRPVRRSPHVVKRSAQGFRALAPGSRSW